MLKRLISGCFVALALTSVSPVQASVISISSMNCANNGGGYANVGYITCAPIISGSPTSYTWTTYTAGAGTHTFTTPYDDFTFRCVVNSIYHVTLTASDGTSSATASQSVRCKSQAD